MKKDRVGKLRVTVGWNVEIGKVKELFSQPIVSGTCTATCPGIQTERKELRTQIKQQTIKAKRQQSLWVNSPLLPIIASLVGASVMEGDRERSGCEGLHVYGATKWSGAKRMTGDAGMGQLCMGDGVMVGGNDWGVQHWGDPCRWSPIVPGPWSLQHEQH